MIEPVALAKDLAVSGVAGVTVAWADNNGIPRSRTVPVAGVGRAAEVGIGVTPLFAVFDSHDGITFDHPGLGTPSGDVRLMPVLDRATQLCGQPALAWAPGYLMAADGSPWPYDQRTALVRQVEAAAADGFEIKAGYEIEFAICAAGSDEPVPAHAGPAYSPHALVDVDEFIGTLLNDFADNGLPIGQLHAEYGFAQVEVTLAESDPVTAAERQLLARQTIHAAAHARGLRACFAPLVVPEAPGNGWHLHTSVWRDGQNLLAGDATTGPTGPGASYLAGLLRDLPGIAAVGAPSVPSLTRIRPGYFAGAYSFWGIENREAPLRYVPGSELLGRDHANVEFKVSDASGNPYLALAAVIAAGVGGIRDGLSLPPPIQDDPGTWTESQRTDRGLVGLPTSPKTQEEALLAAQRVTDALGDPLLGAFLAVRRSDAAWAAERTVEEIVAAHRWRY